MTTFRPRVAFVLLFVCGAAPAHAQTYTWGPNSGDWTFDGSWAGGLAPSGAGAGDTLVFAGPSGYTATNNYFVGALPAVYLNRLTTGEAADVLLNTPGAFPNHTPLRFLGASAGITHAGTGTLDLLTPVNVGTGRTVGITVNGGAGQATFGSATSNTGSFLLGAGAASITNNSAAVARLGNLENHFAGTLSLAGGNFRAVRTGGDLFGNRVVLDVAAGAAFDFNTIGDTFGGLSGGGTVVFGGNNYTFQSDADLTFSGGITGTTGGFEKGGRSGNATYTWAGDAAYTGGPTTVSNGTLRLAGGGRIGGTTAYTVRNGAALVLDNTGSANHNDRLNNAAPVTLAGNLTLLGRNDTATAEVVGDLVIAGTAGSRVTVAPGGGTGTAVLTVGTVSRGNARGAFVEFAGAGTVAVTGAPVLTNGILGYAAKGADWATVGGGAVVALTTYQTSPDPAAWAAADNVAVGGALAGPVGTRTVNSLKITGSSPIDLGGGTLTLTTGGILAAESATVANGTLVGNQAANREVVAFVAAGKTLTINSAIGDAGTQSLVKAGPGALVLGGANAHSGGTFVHGGTLEVSADANLGAAGAPVAVADATLRLTGNGTISSGRTLTLSGWNNTIDVTGTTTAAFAAVTANTASGGFTKTGTGTIVGNATGLVGPITVSAGTFRTSGVALGGENVVTVAAGAVLDLSFNPAAENLGTLSGAGEVRYRDNAGVVLFADPTNPTDTTFAGTIRSFRDGAAGTGAAGVTFGPAVATGHGGTITLAGASDYLGPTAINLGTVRVTADVLTGANGPLGNPGPSDRTVLLGNTLNTSRTNAALLIGAAGVTVGRDVTVRNSATPHLSFGVVTLGSDHPTGDSTFSGTITASKAFELTVAGSATTTFTGLVTGARGFVKVGTGTAVLNRSNGNTYTGLTYVAEGTLLANNGPAGGTNSATGTAAVIVGGGRFGGAGRVTGGVIVYPGGTVAPGSGASPFENLDLSGATESQFYAGGTLAINVGTSPTASSQLTVTSTGNLNLTAVTTAARLNITLTAVEGLTLQVPYTVVVVNHANPGGVITYDGSGFDPNKFNVTAGNFVVSGAGFTVSQGTGDQIVISFTPVPEPAALLAVAAGAFGAAGLVRRGRRVAA